MNLELLTTFLQEQLYLKKIAKQIKGFKILDNAMTNVK